MRVSSTAILVLLLVALLTYPWVSSSGTGWILFRVTTLVVLVLGLIQMRNNRRWLFPALAIILPTGVISIFADPVVKQSSVALHLSSAAAFLFVAVNLIVFAFRSGRVSAERLSAIVSGYLMVGYAWSFLYTTVALEDPQAFTSIVGSSHSSMDYLYFSFVTLTTVGYGDIAPTSNLARSLAIVEAIFGTLYLVVLVSRMVADFGQERSHARDADS